MKSTKVYNVFQFSQKAPMHYGKMDGIGKVQVCKSNDIYQKNPFLKSKLFYKRHFIYKLELFLQI